MLPPQNSGLQMCAKCQLIDKKIAQLRLFANADLDALSRAAMRAAIDSMKAEKASFNCADQK
jgi:hypothetical protein